MPPRASDNGRLFLARVAALAQPLRQSLAVSVGKMVSSVARSFPFAPRSLQYGTCLQSPAIRLGSKQPPPFPWVGSPKVTRRDLDCWRDKVTQLSKVMEGSAEGLDADILCEDIIGAALLNNSEHLRPQLAFILFTFA